jgi:hypothetical protein
MQCSFNDCKFCLNFSYVCTWKDQQVRMRWFPNYPAVRFRAFVAAQHYRECTQTTYGNCSSSLSFYTWFSRSYKCTVKSSSQGLKVLSRFILN